MYWSLIQLERKLSSSVETDYTWLHSSFLCVICVLNTTKTSCFYIPKSAFPCLRTFLISQEQLFFMYCMHSFANIPFVGFIFSPFRLLGNFTQLIYNSYCKIKMITPVSLLKKDTVYVWGQINFVPSTRRVFLIIQG